MNHILIASILSLLPISELRGGIPYLLAYNYSVLLAYPLCVGLNFLVCPICYIFLNTAHRFFYRFHWYMKFFNFFVERSRRKTAKYVDKYGYWGIMLFVAVPLPVTGAYTGTMGAWVLGLSKRKTMLAAAGGVMISGIIVSVVVLMGIEALDIFIKHRGG